MVKNPLSALTEIKVLHWHGDTFELPKSAELLVSSEIYPNQAFRVGANILALQFHTEVASDNLEKWLIGHTCELRKANIDIPTLRADNQKYAGQLEQASSQVLKDFIDQLTIAHSISTP